MDWPWATDDQRARVLAISITLCICCHAYKLVCAGIRGPGCVSYRSNGHICRCLNGHGRPVYHCLNPAYTTGSPLSPGLNGEYSSATSSSSGLPGVCAHTHPRCQSELLASHRHTTSPRAFPTNPHRPAGHRCREFTETLYILFIGIRTLFDRVTPGYGDHSPLTRPKEEVTHGGRGRRGGGCRCNMNMVAQGPQQRCASGPVGREVYLQSRLLKRKLCKQNQALYLFDCVCGVLFENAMRKNRSNGTVYTGHQGKTKAREQS